VISIIFAPFKLVYYSSEKNIHISFLYNFHCFL